MELLHINYLMIESKTKERDINILVVMDHFTSLCTGICY